jgi:lysozyme
MAKRRLKRRQQKRIKTLLILSVVVAIVFLITRPTVISRVKLWFYHPDTRQVDMQESQRELSDYAVFGIDVSEYQEVVVWKKLMHDDAPDFVFIRASAGNDHRDRYFTYNWRETGRVDVIRGAYHYYRPDENSISQAENYISQVNLEAGDLPPVLDIEDYSSVQSLSRLKIGLLRWLKAVEEHYGVKPIIYTYYKFYDNHLKGDERFADYPLWLARYGQNGNFNSPGSDWLFWQYSKKGRVAGIHDDVDLNVFCCDKERLLKMCL